MPCRDDFADSRDYQENIDELNKVTRMLCSLCKTCQRENCLDFIKNAGCEEWWNEHQAADNARFERERQEQERKLIKQKALSKLTEEERSLLGLSK